jgi:hypothetical protein
VSLEGGLVERPVAIGALDHHLLLVHLPHLCVKGVQFLLRVGVEGPRVLLGRLGQSFALVAGLQGLPLLPLLGALRLVNGQALHPELAPADVAHHKSGLLAALCIYRKIQRYKYTIFTCKIWSKKKDGHPHTYATDAHIHTPRHHYYLALPCGRSDRGHGATLVTYSAVNTRGKPKPKKK